MLNNPKSYEQVIWIFSVIVKSQNVSWLVTEFQCCQRQRHISSVMNVNHEHIE